MSALQELIEELGGPRRATVTIVGTFVVMWVLALGLIVGLDLLLP